MRDASNPQTYSRAPAATNRHTMIGDGAMQYSTPCRGVTTMEVTNHFKAVGIAAPFAAYVPLLSKVHLAR